MRDGVRGLAVGAAGGTSLVVTRQIMARHPRLAKSALAADVLGAVIAALPPERRPQVVKAAGVVLAVAVALAVLLIVIMLVVGAAAHPKPATTYTPTITQAPTVAPACEWGTLCPAGEDPFRLVPFRLVPFRVPFR